MYSFLQAYGSVPHEGPNYEILAFAFSVVALGCIIWFAYKISELQKDVLMLKIKLGVPLDSPEGGESPTGEVKR